MTAATAMNNSLPAGINLSAYDSIDEKITAVINIFEEKLSKERKERKKLESEIEEEREKRKELESRVAEDNETAARNLARTNARVSNLEDKAESGASPKASNSSRSDSERAAKTELVDLLARQGDNELRDKGKSMHVRIAAEIHRNRERFSSKARAGKVFNQRESIKKLLEASLDTRVAWKQIHRAMAYLDRESGRYEHKKHAKHGNILVLTPSSAAYGEGG